MTNNINIEKVTVIGLGSSGVKIAQSLASHSANSWINIHGIDTDRKVIEKSSLENKHLVGQSHDLALGCGGNVIKGSRLIARERKLIKEVIKDSALVIVTGGLGGGTLTGGAKSIASVANELKIPCIFILSTPFALEGDMKCKTAQDGLDDLLTTKGLVFPLANDLIFSSLDGDCSAKDAFEYATDHMAMVVASFCDMMCCDDLLKIDFSTMYNIMNKKSNQCSLGCSVVDYNENADVAQELLDGILASPFMTGKKYLKEADAAFLIISADEKVSLNAVKKTLELASDLVATDAALCTGAALNKVMNGKIMLTAVAVQYAENSKNKKIFSHGEFLISNNRNDLRDEKENSLFGSKSFDNKKVKNNVRYGSDSLADIFVGSNHDIAGEYEEVGLGLIHYSRGYFESTPPNRFNGEDLDVPTFQRRNVTIKK